LVHTIGDRRQLGVSPRRSAQVQLNQDVVALYVADAHSREGLAEDEYNALLARGLRTLGDKALTLADRLTRIDEAWSSGLLTEEEYDIVRRNWWPDLDRLERCYSIVLGTAVL
jgi:hypothetical protein